MDPDTILEEMLDLAGHILDQPEPMMDGDRLANLVVKLHSYIRDGGPLPALWAFPDLKEEEK